MEGAEKQALLVKKRRCFTHRVYSRNDESTARCAQARCNSKQSSILCCSLKLSKVYTGISIAIKDPERARILLHGVQQAQKRCHNAETDELTRQLPNLLRPEISRSTENNDIYFKIDLLVNLFLRRLVQLT